ncbi:MAG: hypothetical protein KIT14_02220 [bacterium]|nr:hypothetical protein [bacterium]
MSDTRHRLQERRQASHRYDFDTDAVHRLIRDIYATSAPSHPATINVVEVYTLDRFCSSFPSAQTAHVLLDYGFVELLIDNLTVEHLSVTDQGLVAAWFQAGQPEPSDAFARDIGISGSMIMRDIACKLLDGIVKNDTHRARLMDTLLWSTDDGA